MSEREKGQTFRAALATTSLGLVIAGGVADIKELAVGGAVVGGAVILKTYSEPVVKIVRGVRARRRASIQGK